MQTSKQRMEEIKQNSEIPAFYCSKKQHKNSQAKLSRFHKKQCCRILEEEKIDFKEEIKAFCKANKNLHEEIRVFQEESKAKALWKEINIFQEKNKAFMEEIKNISEESKDFLQKSRVIQMEKKVFQEQVSSI